VTKKVLVSGVLAGIVLFFWGFVSHMLLPIGTAGFHVLSDDTALLDSMAKVAPEPGIYFYPRLDPTNQAGMEAWAGKAASGPSGLIIHRPRGGTGMTPRLLVNELVSNIACGLAAAFLLAHLRPMSFGRRVACVALLGALAWLAVDFSQWNWYGFPAAYTLGAFFDQTVGFALMGFVLARAFRD